MKPLIEPTTGLITGMAPGRCGEGDACAKQFDFGLAGASGNGAFSVA